VPLAELKAATAAFSAAAVAYDQSAIPWRSPALPSVSHSHCTAGRRDRQHILRRSASNQLAHRRTPGRCNLIRDERTTLQGPHPQVGHPNVLSRGTPAGSWKDCAFLKGTSMKPAANPKHPPLTRTYGSLRVHHIIAVRNFQLCSIARHPLCSRPRSRTGDQAQGFYG